MFFDMSKYAYFESLFSTIYIEEEKTQMLKKFPSNKINVIKMPTFFFRELITSQFYF